jgi:protein SCO1/2
MSNLCDSRLGQKRTACLSVPLGLLAAMAFGLALYAIGSSISLKSSFGRIAGITPAVPVGTSGGEFNVRQISHITLTDQDGERVRLHDVPAGATLLNFMFTGCNTECPLQTAQLRSIYHQLESNAAEQTVQIISVTISPLTDTVPALKSYVTAFNVDYPNWRFLRADMAGTNELLDRFSVLSTRAVESRTDHRNVLYLINRHGDLVQQYAADPINIKRVTAEVGQLLSL